MVRSIWLHLIKNMGLFPTHLLPQCLELSLPPSQQHVPLALTAAHLQVMSSAWMLTGAPGLIWQQPSSAAERSPLSTGPEQVFCVQGVFSDRYNSGGSPHLCSLSASAPLRWTWLQSHYWALFPVLQKVPSWTKSISEHCSKRKVQSRTRDPLTSLFYG